MNGRMGNFIDDLRSTSGKAAKQSILKDYDSDEVRYLLRQAYDPNILHNISFGRIELPSPGPFTLEDTWDEVIQLFKFISISQSRNDNREACIQVFRHLKMDDQELLLGVINKNLKAGISIRSINEAYPDLIKVYPIQLANKYEVGKRYGVKEWEWSFKLDGMRIFAFRWDNGEWSLHTRRRDWLGPEIHTLNHWKESLEVAYKQTCCNFFDGEAFRYGLQFEEIQSLVMSKVNKKTDEVKVLQYHVFIEGWCDDPPDTTTCHGFRVASRGSFKPDLIRGVGLGRIGNLKNHVENSLTAAVNNGYEGIVLRDPNKPYSLKRDKHLLKVKKAEQEGVFETSDCVVIDMEYDEFTHIVDGEVVISQLPVRLKVRQKNGKICGVGTGFKMHHRLKWDKESNRILDKTIEVVHQGYGIKGLMRFPSYKRTREDL